MTQREAAIRAQIVRVRESLDELESLLEATPKPQRTPRRPVKAEPRVTPSTEAVGVMRRRLRSLGVRA